MEFQKFKSYLSNNKEKSHNPHTLDSACGLETKAQLDIIQQNQNYLGYLAGMQRGMLQLLVEQTNSTNLDNCIRDCGAMPDMEGETNVYHRQKLTIAGVTQWRSFSSMQDLVNLVTESVQAAIQTNQSKKSDILFGDYMLSWYHNFKERTISENYRENYTSIMNTHIIPAIGSKRVADITVADIQAIMDTLTSASYAKQTKCIINMVLDSAIADEIYTHPNPTKDPRLVMPTTVKKREAVSKDDLSTVIQLLPTMPKDYAKILTILIMTGCRRGEALGVMWQDIDWAAKTIHLQRVVRFMRNRPVVSDKMKTKSANRTVALWDAFIPYLGERKESGYIINCDGEPLTETMWRNRWNAIAKLLKKAGIERFTAHQLRHSYATMAANSGKIPPKVLQGMLGHANFQTTMNIYAGFDNDKVCESSQSLSEEYSKLAEKSCTEVADTETVKNPALSTV